MHLDPIAASKGIAYMNDLLLGDEAVGLAAIHAGISGAFSYPGTPATEILEFIQRHPQFQDSDAVRWSTNEKVAYEQALGMSFAGRRALVSMKHVGLNVAADPWMSSALTGAHGGLVLAVADDPGMHSSQSEQDSRFYADFARIPLFEPANQQEAYDMTREAFELSESFQIPVMVRLVTRLAHSRANVRCSPAAHPRPLGRATDWHKWTLLPANARQRYRRLLNLQPGLQSYADDSPHNLLVLRGTQGIIACGLARNYVAEVLGDAPAYSVLQIGVYPPPQSKIAQLVNHCRALWIVEEGHPLLETRLLGLLGPAAITIHGKTTGALPPDGELSAEGVRAALGRGAGSTHQPPADLPARPPQLCQGCPHCDTFKAITAASPDQRPYYFGDIGCYALAALPPYNAIDTCVDMGASIGMGIGAAKAGAHPIICTIGDSTFVHSGLSALLEAAALDVNMTVVILDNATVAMTGAQEVFASGESLIRVIRGLGVDPAHLIRIDPLPQNHERNAALLQREIDHPGLSVVVACRRCIHLKRQRTVTPEPAALTTKPTG